MTKQTAIVTRESLRTMLLTPNRAYVEKVVGRALVVLFRNQTATEQHANTTNNDNGVGFTGADARSGSLTAKYYMKHQHLTDWQLDRWIKAEASGFPKLCKYWRQLNEVALNNQRVSK